MLFMIFGVIAIVATIINLYLYKAGKDYKLAMAMGLSLTALVPGMERALWFLTIASILLNIAPILLERKGMKE